jgi:uncharacterized protein
MLYPGDRFRMADDLLETYVRQLLESQPGPEITVAWQGGGPTLMGIDFFRRAMAYASKYRRPGVTVAHTIQTNGTELTADWCEFFREHSFLVGLSLDGPREMHDLYRVDKGGQPTFDNVMRAARVLQAHGVEFNILTTVHAGNASHPPEVYRFLRDEVGTHFIQFIPIVERVTPEMLPLANQGWGARGSDPRPLYLQDGSLVTDRTVQPEAWGHFLNAIFDEWVTRDVGTVFIQMFDAALASWVGAPAGMCIFAETCGDAVALEHNGDLYSCDHFVEPTHLLGHIKRCTCCSSSSRSSSARSAPTSVTRCRPIAASARCDSPVMASARRTGSFPRPMESRASTTCAPATCPSSRTSTGRCG